MTLPTTDPAEAVADRQPPELRHETIWRDCAYAFTLIARYLRADPWLGTLLVAIAFGMTSFASYLGVKMSVQLMLFRFITDPGCGLDFSSCC